VPLNDGANIFRNAPEKSQRVLELSTALRDDFGIYPEIVTYSGVVSGQSKQWGVDSLGLPKVLLLAVRGENIAYRVNQTFLGKIPYSVHQYHQKDWAPLLDDSKSNYADRLIEILETMHRSYSTRIEGGLTDENGALLTPDRSSGLFWAVLLPLLAAVPALWLILRELKFAGADGKTTVSTAEKERQSRVRIFPNIEALPRRFGGKYSGGTAVERGVGD